MTLIRLFPTISPDVFFNVTEWSSSQEIVHRTTDLLVTSSKSNGKNEAQRTLLIRRERWRCHAILCKTKPILEGPLIFHEPSSSSSSSSSSVWLESFSNWLALRIIFLKGSETLEIKESCKDPCLSAKSILISLRCRPSDWLDPPDTGRGVFVPSSPLVYAGGEPNGCW